MAVRLSTAARNAAVTAVGDLVDAGLGAGIVRIYSGSQPASADDPASGVLLAAFTVNDPAFGVAAAGIRTLDTAPAISTTGIAAGDAGWFRMVDSTGATVLDGSVTASGGGGDMIITTVTVSIGLTLQLSSGTITMPAS